jgi:1,5-anhydro-D-fructose reductase (1,5-anhydro-D-mannitol-forming)
MKLRLAQLGRWHVHTLEHVQAARTNPHTEMSLLWDSEPVAGKEFAAEHGLEFIEDLESLLERDDVDGVVVDTATTEHPNVIAAALNSGKHVFTEKVLAASVEDAEKLIRLANENGLVLRVSLQRLIEAPIRTAKHLIDEGRIGKVTAVNVRYAHQGALGHPWIPDYFFDLEQAGGGALLDLGAHPLYLNMLFTGEEPTSISANISYTQGLSVEDNVTALLTYPSGALGVAEASFVASFFGYSVQITGTGGSITIGPEDYVVRMRVSGETDWIAQDLEPALPSTFDQFVDIVRSRESNDDHLRLVRVLTRTMTAGYEAARTGTRIPITPV